MKNMKKGSILIFTILITSCNTQRTEFGNAEISRKLSLTNIKELSENQTAFDNDTLKIIGELHLDLENKGIFSKSEKIWINSFKPTTELDSTWKKLNGKEVEIIGLYKAGKTGHLGLYNGQFKEVYYIKTE